MRGRTSYSTDSAREMVEAIKEILVSLVQLVERESRRADAAEQECEALKRELAEMDTEIA